jgi:hypothetical protein
VQRPTRYIHASSNCSRRSFRKVRNLPASAPSISR